MTFMDDVYHLVDALNGIDSKGKKRVQVYLIPMGNMISRSRKRKKRDDDITEADKAVLSLRTQRRKLNGERKRLEETIEKNAEAIRTLMAKHDKQKALLALKKKKMREEQLKNIDNWLLHVEHLLSNIEMATQQNAIVAALRVGADALKDLQKEVSVEDVEKLTQDTEDAKAYFEEIQEALGHDSAEDVAELEAELDALEAQLVEEEKIDMPSAPTTAVEHQKESRVVEEQETMADTTNAKAETPLLA